MRDLHSGMYGGAAPNAVFGLVELLSKLKDANGHIQIPGIYDDVEPPSPAEKHSWSILPFDEKEFLKIEVGSTQLTGESGFTVLETGLGAPDAGGAWNCRWLRRRWSKNSNSGKSHS